MTRPTVDAAASPTTPTTSSEGPYTHLIILCCHAVYHGSSGSSPLLESNWALKPFQKSTPTKSGEHTTFLQHTFAAVQLHAQDDKSIVVFSGGPTDAAYPDLSEARSYRNAYQDWSHLLGLQTLSEEEIILEEYATDSFQNVLFSILEFRRKFRHYPKDLMIVTHAFKNERFLKLHAKALKWDVECVKVLGINPPFTITELEGTTAGEKRNGFAPWETDLYGVRDVLAGKRKARGWEEQMSEELGEGFEPAVQRLLRYDGGSSGVVVFPERLPWE